jgi:hypothetical protein
VEAHGGADAEILRSAGQRLSRSPPSWRPVGERLSAMTPQRTRRSYAGDTRRGRGGPVSGFCWKRHPNGPFATLIRPAATGWPIRIAADGTCQVWRGEEVWQSDSLNGITLHQLPQIPDGGDFYQFSTQRGSAAELRCCISWSLMPTGAIYWSAPVVSQADSAGSIPVTRSTKAPTLLIIFDLLFA